MTELRFTEFGSGYPLLVLHGGKLDHRHMVDAIEPVDQVLCGRHLATYEPAPWFLLRNISVLMDCAFQDL